VEGRILGREANLRNARSALDAVNAARPDRIFLIGGTCASELVPVAWLNQHYKGDLALLWFDAHGDLNTPRSSASKHFHGMVLRTLLGEGDARLLEYVPLPLRPEQLTLAGTRALDPPEADYIARTGIIAFPPVILKDPSRLVAAAGRAGASNLYIHLDLDFFNPVDFPSVLIPTAGGMVVDSLVPILRELKSAFNVVGTSVVEFAPKDPDAARRIPVLFQRSGINLR
jgi:arginase